MNNNKPKSHHPDWVIKHKKPGTEIKKISNRYYLYSVSSKYDKTLKRPRKISGKLLGSITEDKGFIPSGKRSLQKKAEKTYLNKKVFSVEYGFSRWLVDILKSEGILDRLQTIFPGLWQFVVAMVYCRTAWQSPLKNIVFNLDQSDLMNIIGWEEKLSDQKISNYLYTLGSDTGLIHQYLEPEQKERKCVLVDATDIATHSKNPEIAAKGYNSKMNFQPQFVLLYLYDASTLRPLYYRILPGNIRDVSALSNTIAASGIEKCIFIADKGFYSERNIKDLEEAGLEYIIPLRRSNAQVSYESLKDIELTDNYFEYNKRHIFYADPIDKESRRICLYQDGTLREQEKNDYLRRIKSVPEYYSKENFKLKVSAMGTLSLIYNAELSPHEVYVEYKQRGDIEQFFDHLKNTIDASSSSMQRMESLHGWMFINHISMQVVYHIYRVLKTTSLNKKQTLNHKYSVMDTVDHLKSIKKIAIGNNESIITEINKLTRTLIEKINLSIT